MKVENSLGMARARQSEITLAALLDLLQDEVRVLVIRRLRPHESEVMAVGTACTLRSSGYAQAHSGHSVEKISVDKGELLGRECLAIVITVSRDFPRVPPGVPC